ncbi:glycine cleavage system aminomethyltransferase T [Bacillus sp. SG-1]|nr:glycine cleavage system aminomethyltransferase T [Bacillus sp. SG-1]
MDNSAEGASKFLVNLSGKKTLAGRISGECFSFTKPPKKKSHQMVKLSGERTEDLLTRGCSVLFCVLFE